MDYKTFVDSVSKGFMLSRVNHGVEGQLFQLFLTDLKRKAIFASVDWQASYEKLLSTTSSSVSIATLHKCVVLKENNDFLKIKKSRDMKKQYEAMHDFFSCEGYTLDFIRKFIDVDTRYPNATCYDFRHVPSKVILEALYELATALPEGEEKAKLRAHYARWHKAKAPQRTSIRKVLERMKVGTMP